jgi:hypothetical protein
MQYDSFLKLGISFTWMRTFANYYKFHQGEALSFLPLVGLNYARPHHLTLHLQKVLSNPCPEKH